MALKTRRTKRKRCRSRGKLRSCGAWIVRGLTLGAFGGRGKQRQQKFVAEDVSRIRRDDGIPLPSMGPTSHPIRL